MSTESLTEDTYPANALSRRQYPGRCAHRCNSCTLRCKSCEGLENPGGASGKRNRPCSARAVGGNGRSPLILGQLLVQLI